MPVLRGLLLTSLTTTGHASSIARASHNLEGIGPSMTRTDIVNHSLTSYVPTYLSSVGTEYLPRVYSRIRSSPCYALEVLHNDLLPCPWPKQHVFCNQAGLLYKIATNCLCLPRVHSGLLPLCLGLDVLGSL
ncbi:hypothetical protein BJ166DRAFT_186174 [Pestalotiopsis sp. NC0098]|nr:hypothetical protein BJ166DRAFT_186174 [Pestalotiopsis sp. NC0098]